MRAVVEALREELTFIKEATGRRVLIVVRRRDSSSRCGGSVESLIPDMLGQQIRCRPQIKAPTLIASWVSVRSMGKRGVSGGCRRAALSWRKFRRHCCCRVCGDTGANDETDEQASAACRCPIWMKHAKLVVGMIPCANLSLAKRATLSLAYGFQLGRHAS